jgi:hypothetical protein
MQTLAEILEKTEIWEGWTGPDLVGVGNQWAARGERQQRTILGQGPSGARPEQQKGLDFNPGYRDGTQDLQLNRMERTNWTE